MALNIDGTTGISGVDGSASAPALQGTDSNTGINFASDTVNINTGGVTRATVDSSGNLNIPNDSGKIQLGTSSDLSIFHDGSHNRIRNAVANRNIYIEGVDDEASTPFIYLNPRRNQTGLSVKANQGVDLYYDNSLKARTDNNGFVVDGRFVTGGDYNYLQGNSTSTSTLTLKKSASGADSIDYLQLRNNANELKLSIEGDGDVKNLNNSYGSLSDVNLKENIVDAKSQWDDIKNVKVRNFNFKDDTKKTKMLGVVAQEIETVSAGLVSESIDRDPDTNEDLGTTTKSVKYSILYMKAIKALQEAQARIETLETKVAALEAG